MSVILSFSKRYLRKKLRPYVIADNKKVYLLAGNDDEEIVSEILDRAKFYIPGIEIECILIDKAKSIPIRVALGRSPIIVIGGIKIRKFWPQSLFGAIYDVDYRLNPHDGWNWHALASDLNYKNEDIEKSKRIFKVTLEIFQKENHDKCYIFGTGKSLERAINRDWSDGYRVVCNTIVRDVELWHHINPHYVVAGDAIYHFGHTEFARTFRSDLLKRIKESRAKFVYPASFHSLVKREMHDVEDQLIPIPKSDIEDFNIDLSTSFVLPNMGNVLPLLLLPLACVLSKYIYMLGFDGRAPDDKLFWSNSVKHSYPELIDTLISAHPKFFEHYLKDSPPQSYTKQFHGDKLDQLMLESESIGWKFVLMSKSWTQTLQKRYVEGVF